MRFYNRESEIAELRRIRDLAYTRNSRMTVITGRRRIGKTSLIRKAFDGNDTPLLYFFTGRKTEAALVDDFATEIRAKLGYVPDGLRSVAAVMRYLLEKARTCPMTVAIDEFQEFMNVNPTVFSDMQNLWDSYRYDTRMNLLLSGSAQSMMQRIFTDAHEPLFGRADNIINLRPFRIAVLKDILRDYNPSYSNDDLLALYTITGGIPKYVELLCDNGHLTAEEMLRFTASNMSPFIDEGRHLLITEFGREYGTYFSVLLCIARGYTSQSDITAALGGALIGGHLDRMENTYNIITKFRPILSKPGSRNVVRYRITDNFLQYWFRFIERNRTMVEIDNYADLQTLVLRDYPTYSGIILERYFRQKLMEEGGFRDIGSWWEARAGKAANEVDIVALRTDGHSALVAEVKRSAANYHPETFISKVEHLRTKVLAGYDIDTCLFTMAQM